MVKHCSTSGALPGLVIIKMMLVYDAATGSSPDGVSLFQETLGVDISSQTNITVRVGSGCTRGVCSHTT